MPADAGSCEAPHSAAHDRAPVRPQVCDATLETEAAQSLLRSDGVSRGQAEAYGIENTVYDKEALEKEKEEFVDGLSLKIRSDKKYMDEHMGLHSDRRRASGKYSNDARGRFTYRGVPVNDGGYVLSLIHISEPTRPY